MNTAIRLFMAALLGVATPAPVFAADIPSGNSCSSQSQTLIQNGVLYKCVKSGSRLVWDGGTELSQQLPSVSAPKISGTVKVGYTLKAIVGAWGEDVEYDIAWLRAGKPIRGENDATYVVQKADIGKKLSVRVTGSAPGFQTASRTSSLTKAVPKTVVKVVSGTAKKFSKLGVPFIDGTASVGNLVRVSPGNWDSGVKFTYRWNENGRVIPGATKSTFRIPAELLGRNLTCTVIASKLGYLTQSVSTDSSKVLPSQKTFDATPDPVLVGVARVGQTLSVTGTNWGYGVTFTFQWFRSGVAIDGATAASYPISSDDLGKYLSVAVTGTRANYIPLTKVSNRTAPVVEADVVLKNFNSNPTPVIQGQATAGQKLIAVIGLWDPAAQLTYQWYRSGVEIPGATALEYLLSSDDIGKKITFSVVAVAVGYNPEVKTSSSFGPITLAKFTLSATPSIRGIAKMGETISAVPGTWDSDAVLAFQWLRGGLVIPGAVGASYILTAEDVTKVISVKVTATRLNTETLELTSMAIGPIQASQFAVSATPTISGVLTVGSVLTATSSAWEPDTVFAWQWLRGGVAIAGANTATYKLVTADSGKSISVALTGSKSGYTPLTLTSAGTALVTLALQVLQPTPVVSGAAKSGLTLTADPGVWDAGTTQSYQWYVGRYSKYYAANGPAEPVAGATGLSFTVPSGFKDRYIFFQVTSSKTDYETFVSWSSPAGPVVLQSQVLQPTPVVSGAAKSGLTLTADPGVWDAGTTQSYQWYVGRYSKYYAANGPAEPVAGATGLSFTVPSGFKDRYIFFQVTSSKTDYETFVSWSSPAGPVVLQSQVLQPTPVVSGVAKSGLTLTADPGVWDAGTTLSTQWSYSIYSNGTSLVEIAGATGTTFVVTSDLVGKYLYFRVASSKSDFDTVVRISAGTAKVVNQSQVLQPTPIVSGAPVQGSTLTADPGVWDAGTTLSTQWSYSIYSNGTSLVEIAGATGTTFVVTSDLVGKYLYFRVASSKPDFDTVVRISTATSEVS